MHPPHERTLTAAQRDLSRDAMGAAAKTIEKYQREEAEKAKTKKTG